MNNNIVSDLINFGGYDLVGLQLDLSFTKETWIPDVAVDRYNDSEYYIRDKISRKSLFIINTKNNNSDIEIFGDSDNPIVYIGPTITNSSAVMYRLSIGEGYVFRVPFVKISLKDEKTSEVTHQYLFNENIESYKRILSLLKVIYGDKPIVIKQGDTYVLMKELIIDEAEE